MGTIFWFLFQFIATFILNFRPGSGVFGLGIPGGQRTAGLWLSLTVAVCMLGGLVFRVASQFFPASAEGNGIAVFALTCGAVAGVQRFVIRRQLVAHAEFFSRTWIGSTFALTLLLAAYGSYPGVWENELREGFTVYAVASAGLSFFLFLGLPQGVRLDPDAKPRLMWSLATGVGAAAGVYSANLLFIGLHARMVDLVAPDSSSPELFWTLATTMNILTLVGAACGQAVIIFLHKPVVQRIVAADAEDNARFSEKEPRDL